MKRLLLLGGLVMAAAVLLFYTSLNVSAQGSQAIQISETEFSLTPNSVSVPMGQAVQVTVTNTGAAQHNLTFASPSGSMQKKLFDTNLNPGETRTTQFTFTEAGDWKMFCPVDSHAQQGMQGVIHVMAAASGAATTSTPSTMATSAPSSMTTATPSAKAPGSLPTTGAGGQTSTLLLAAGLGILLIAAGIGARVWPTKKEQ
ncbi:MAG: cupredoxin domain-containing protein [Rudaea sp.]